MEPTLYTEQIDPALAVGLLTMAYEKQRKLNTALVNRYTREMKAGLWSESDSAIIIGRVGSSQFLINGQHRLSAIVASGTTQTFVIRRRAFENMHELDLAYTNMDRGAARNASAQVHALGLGQKLGLADRTVMKSITGLKLVMDNFTEGHSRSANSMTSPIDMERIVDLWGSEFVDYRSCVAETPAESSRWFERAEVVGVALVTLRYSHDLAMDFWLTSAHRELASTNSPEYALYGMLSTAPAARVRGEYARKVAHAWNKKYEGKKEISIIRPGTGEGIIIKGSPWKTSDTEVDTHEVVFGKPQDAT